MERAACGSERRTAAPGRRRGPRGGLSGLAPVAFAALLLAACSDISGPSGTPTGTVVVQETSAGGDTVPVPPEVETFRFTAHEPDGTVVYGPRDVPRASEVVLDQMPISAQTLQIDYLGASASPGTDGPQIATFTTSFNLQAGGEVTIVDPRLVDTRDPIDSSFVAIGCNRLAQAQVSPSVPSSANVGQLVKDFEEIPTPGKLEPTPRRVFFMGDLVTNLMPGTATLESQLMGWKALYATTPLATSPIALVAITGNHELLQQVTAPPPGDDEANETQQIPNPPTGEVFTSLMAQFIPASNGPTTAPPNLDNVQRNESQLSFSFADGPSLFVVVDTETYEGGDQPSDTGLVPLNWLQEMISAANADPAIHQIFVIGHRPIDSPDPLNAPMNPVDALPFYQILAAPGPGGSPTKVRGYFAAHAHLWNQGVPTTAPPGSTLRQVIAGNGGSTVAAVFSPPIGYYGYTFVGITRAGAVVVQSYGRPIPTPYNSSDPQPETILRENLTLAQAGS